MASSSATEKLLRKRAAMEAETAVMNGSLPAAHGSGKEKVQARGRALPATSAQPAAQRADVGQMLLEVRDWKRGWQMGMLLVYVGAELALAYFLAAQWLTPFTDHAAYFAPLRTTSPPIHHADVVVAMVSHMIAGVLAAGALHFNLRQPMWGAAVFAAIPALHWSTLLWTTPALRPMWQFHWLPVGGLALLGGHAYIGHMFDDMIDKVGQEYAAVSQAELAAASTGDAAPGGGGGGGGGKGQRGRH